jgi:F420H(2)-dependent quinone reductase
MTAHARLPPRWVIRLAWVVHRAIHRLTGGRIGLRPASATSYGTMRVLTVGRRSGAQRAVILGYFDDGADLVTMAMNGWADPEPAWWLNLRANPDAMVDLPGGRRRVTARAAVGEERARLWAALVGLGTAAYTDASAALRSHETAIVVLEPRDA